jgi:hypothetical protein
VPQVPLLYGILVGYGSKPLATLDGDFLRKIPRARRAREARGGPNLNCDGQKCLSTRVHTRVAQF